MISDCFVSVVAPLHDDADILEEFLAELTGVLRRHYENYEVVLVDDGSTDETPRRVDEALAKHEYLRVITLTRRFGQEVAIAAGLDSVIGDYVVVMLPDSDPPERIPQMVEHARRCGGIVLGVLTRRGRQGPLVRLGTRLFYWYVNRVLQLGFPQGTRHFRVMSREAVNGVIQIKDRMRFLRSFTAYVGYKNEEFPYEPISRRGVARRERGVLESLELAINLVVANSTHPLRVVTVLGLVVSGLNALYVSYVLILTLFRYEHLTRGWATLSIQNSVMFFVLFLVIAVLAEYVGRILAETWNRPIYYVREERNSSAALLHADRRNVVTASSDPT
jgi:dolichol-phosphate mannosyltransferase